MRSVVGAPNSETRAARGAVQRWLPVAFLLAAPIACFWPAVTGRLLLAPYDGLWMFLPLRLIARDQLAAGQAPLWNAWIFSGFPLLGAMIAGAANPLNALFLLLPPALATNAITLVSLVVAGLATYAYARRIGCGRAAACFSGVTFAFSGPLTARLGNTPMLQGMVWLPLMLLAVERLRQQPAPRGMALGAVAVALALVAGHPQMPAYALATLALYAAARLPAVAPAGRRRYAAGISALLAGGALLAAAQLLPAAELARLSVRSELSFADFVTFSLSLGQLPALGFPFLLGDAVAGLPEASYWGALEHCGYAGVTALLLALAALGGARRDPLVRLWALLGGGALLLALGEALPFARVLYHVPLLGLFRIPARLLFVFTFAVAVLAGIGLSRAPRRALLAAAGLGLAAMAATAAAWVVAGDRLWGGLLDQMAPNGLQRFYDRGAFALANRAVWWPLATTALAAALLGVLARRRAAAALLALLALQSADLFLFVRALPVTYPLAAEALRTPAWTRAVAAEGAGAAADRFAVVTPGGTAPFDYRPVLVGLPAIQGYDALILRDYAAATGIDYAGRLAEPSLRAGAPALDLLAARWLALRFPARTESNAVWDGVQLPQLELSTVLRGGEALELPLPGGVRATRLVVISMLGGAVGVAQGTPVADVTLDAADGSVWTEVLRAGVDTAEWAWERPDVSPIVRHARAPVYARFAADGGSGLKYAGGVDWRRPVDLVRVRIAARLPDVTLQLARLALFDAASGRSHALTGMDGLRAQPSRWALHAVTDEPPAASAALPLPAVLAPHASLDLLPPDAGGARVEVLENLAALPRAWLVPRSVALPPAAVLDAVRSGRLPDGRRFDPRAVALVEEAGVDFNPLDVGASVAIDPRSGVIHTRGGPAFLVVSEMFYPGWRATIDGVDAPIVRTNAVLRGLALPPGDHVVRFSYAPLSAVAGAMVSALAAVGLAVVARRR